MVIDWQRHSRRGRGWFAGDGLHVSDRGARAFAAYLRRRLDPFVGPPRSLRIPASAAGARTCATLRRGGRTLEVLVVRARSRVVCARARRLARTAPPAAIGGWRTYDFRRSGRRPWSEVYVRADRRVVVVTRPARRARSPSAGSPPARAA